MSGQNCQVKLKIPLEKGTGCATFTRITDLETKSSNSKWALLFRENIPVQLCAQSHQEAARRYCSLRDTRKVLEQSSATDLDGPVPRGWHNVLVIKVHHVDSSPVSHQDAAQGDVRGGGHVPHGDGPILGARHHQPIAEPQMEHGLVVVDQRVQNFPCVHIPDSAGERSVIPREAMALRGEYRHRPPPVSKGELWLAHPWQQARKMGAGSVLTASRTASQAALHVYWTPSQLESQPQCVKGH